MINLKEEITLSNYLLELTAISGEFPADLLHRLGGGDFYIDKIITVLKSKKLLKLHYKDKLRGYRLTKKSKEMLLSQNPERFTFYLTGTTETNKPKSEYTRRLRLHQFAETYILMINSEICIFRDKKLPLFSSEVVDTKPTLDTPTFYSSREMKELGREFTMIRNSRCMGVLLCPDIIYVVYNTSNNLLKWEYKTEIRVVALMQHYLCNNIFNKQLPIRAVMIASNVDIALKLMQSKGGVKKRIFRLDSSYEHFHFISNDINGETLLKILVSPKLRMELNKVLSTDLQPKNIDFPIEHDAVDKNGRLVLFAYDYDMLRIAHFNSGLSVHQLSGTIICFDFQKNSIADYINGDINFSTIDIQKLKRRLLI